MKTYELRKRYFDFFEEKNHKIFPSDTLVPDDESVLFTSAGMNQFKPYFLGKKKDVKRAVSCQKCLRTGDLYRVGTTAYHHTFFEMLGNFSFGDYFKREAIKFAWDFLINELNLKEEALWVSVYKEDPEAYRVWEKDIRVPKARIVKLGEGSNFWPANAPKEGPNGPCGPCSEIFFDKGKDAGCGKADCGPDCSCSRFVEIWNLVFTQFERRGIDDLEPLPQKNIDTGMGLERMASVLQGKDTNFGIDIFAPAVKEAKEILKAETANKDTRSTVNAIVDHARAVIFAIADGVYPSNEQRGYVIRKILRRASVKAALLGCQAPFIYRFTGIFAHLMGDFYNEIREKEDIISKVIKAEEEKYLSIRKQGALNLQSRLDDLKSGELNKAQVLFEFYDTHGLSLEESGAILKEKNLEVSPADEREFEEFLSQQQERSRKKSMFDENIFAKGVSFAEITEFSGYRNFSEESGIIKILSSRG
ncbi:MAG: alanine--tRNA ligase, partial [Candidatus Omnitrophica bacterium]|nr:alanine--tRNA ligase [Candidatus Omnitrophota bacterium]MBD3269498.1 alanine--tRNA ligase [Candidatus Omnitrophota bacterium]